jgi:hypothetical protein
VQSALAGSSRHPRPFGYFDHGLSDILLPLPGVLLADHQSPPSTILLLSVLGGWRRFIQQERDSALLYLRLSKRCSNGFLAGTVGKGSRLITKLVPHFLHDSA